MTDIILVTLPRAAIWVRDAVRADRANAYGLDAPWTLPTLGGDLRGKGLMPPDYFGPGFHIAGGVVTELPFPVDPRECDGCTFSPDWWPRTWGGLRAYVAAIFHDRWYRCMEAMAIAWGWTVERVRALGDAIFASILHSLARLLPFWSRQRAYLATRVYYSSVRAFGGVGHAAYKRLEERSGESLAAECAAGPAAAKPLAVAGVLAAIGAALAGCHGCAVPCAWEDPDAEIAIPAHSYSNLLTGATWSYSPIPRASGIGAHKPSDPAGATASAGTEEAE